MSENPEANPQIPVVEERDIEKSDTSDNEKDVFPSSRSPAKSPVPGDPEEKPLRRRLTLLPFEKVDEVAQKPPETRPKLPARKQGAQEKKEMKQEKGETKEAVSTKEGQGAETLKSHYFLYTLRNAGVTDTTHPWIAVVFEALENAAKKIQCIHRKGVAKNAVLQKRSEVRGVAPFGWASDGPGNAALDDPEVAAELEYAATMIQCLQRQRKAKSVVEQRRARHAETASEKSNKVEPAPVTSGHVVLPHAPKDEKPQGNPRQPAPRSVQKSVASKPEDSAEQRSRPGETKIGSSAPRKSVAAKNEQGKVVEPAPTSSAKAPPQQPKKVPASIETLHAQQPPAKAVSKATSAPPPKVAHPPAKAPAPAQSDKKVPTGQSPRTTKVAVPKPKESPPAPSAAGKRGPK